MICITKKAFREKFCFPFPLAEQITADRLENRLVGVALVTVLQIHRQIDNESIGIFVYVHLDKF